MGGGGDSETSSQVRYAPYFEENHQNLLWRSREIAEDGAGGITDEPVYDYPTKSIIRVLNEALGNSPFGAGQELTPDTTFLGSGYSIGDFPSLYDMFGKFMAGLDVHTLFEQTYNGLYDSPSVSAAIESHAAMLADDITQNVYPRFEAGMRDIGAVNSSAFAAGRALIEDSRIKSINEYSAKLQLGLLETATKMWSDHLNWNRNVIAVYHGLTNLYTDSVRDANAHNIELAHKDVLFDLSLYEYARAMLGVVSGAMGTVEPKGPTQFQKSASATLGGAAAGYQTTGTWQGAVIGGVIGLASSFF